MILFTFLITLESPWPLHNVGFYSSLKFCMVPLRGLGQFPGQRELPYKNKTSKKLHLEQISPNV